MALRRNGRSASVYFKLDSGNRWLAITTLAILYFLAILAGHQFYLPASQTPLIWLAPGLGLAATLLFGSRIWPGLLLGAAAGWLWHGLGQHLWQDCLVPSLANALIETASALAGGRLIRDRMPAHDPFSQLQNVLKFTASVLLTSLFLAVFLTIVSMFGGRLSNLADEQVMFGWWLAAASGTLVLTPLILCVAGLVRRGVFDTQWLAGPRLMTIAVMAAVAFILAHVVFASDGFAQHQDRLLIYLFLPLLAWGALRYGPLGVTLLMLPFAAAAVMAALQGHGPLYTGNLYSSSILLGAVLGLAQLSGLMLAADRRQRDDKPEPYGWLLMLGLIGFTIMAWHGLSLDSERNLRRQFELSSNEIKTRIEERMFRYQQILRSGIGLFSSSVSVEDSEWHQFYRELHIKQDFPGILGLGFVKWLHGDESAMYAASLRKQGLSDFNIYPAGNREYHAVITYLEPNDADNQHAIGFDMFFEPLRREAIEKARDSGEIALSRHLRLIQDLIRPDPLRAGIIMFMPIYNKNMPTETLEQRRAAFFGLVYAPFRIDELMQGILQVDPLQIGIEIFDGNGNNLGSGQRLYISEALQSISERQRTRLMQHRLEIKVADHTWTLAVTALPAHMAAIDLQKAHLVLIAGWLMSLLLFMLVRTLTTTRESALHLAEQMTVALRSSEDKFRTLAGSALEGIIIADSAGKVVSWNRAAHDIFGYSEQQMLGRELGCIMPERYRVAHRHGMQHLQETGETRITGKSVELHGLSADNREFPIELSLSSWQSGGARFFSAIIRDTTQRKQIEEALGNSHERFRSILAYAPIGMAVVSFDGQWLEFNPALCQMLGYNESELRQLRFKDVVHAEDLQLTTEYGEQLIAGNVPSYQMQRRFIRRDGSVVWALLATSLMRDKHGDPLYFISHIEDIDHLKRAEDELRATLALQSAIVASANQAIIATDTAGLIVAFNAAAEEMLQYPASSMIGQQTPACLHDPAELQQRAQILSLQLGRPVAPDFSLFIELTNTAGSDVSEWIYIRKDGSRFPVELTTTAIRDKDGRLTGYLGVASDISERLQKARFAAEALAEKETLLKEVYHRVKNNLQVITGLFHLQLRSIDNTEARQVLEQASQRVHAMAMVHEKLYRSETLSSIPLDEYLHDLCNHFAHLAENSERTITFKLNLATVHVLLDTAVPLGLIINELVSNSIKHAFPGGRDGEISISLHQLIGGQLSLVIADNGIGMPASEPLDNTLGLRLISSLCRQLKARLDVKSDAGTRVEIQFTPTSH